jgi:hypothetical protein
MTSASHRPSWHAALAAYAQPCLMRGLLELATSVVQYVALSVVMYLTLDVSLVLTVALAILTAGFLVRVFVTAVGRGDRPSAPSRGAACRPGGFAGLSSYTLDLGLVPGPLARRSSASVRSCCSCTSRVSQHTISREGTHGNRNREVVQR